MKQLSEMTTEELKDLLIQQQKVLLSIPQVQQNIAALEQELGKRTVKEDEKKK